MFQLQKARRIILRQAFPGALVVSTLMGLPRIVFAQDCAGCSASIRELSQLHASLAGHEDLMKKNQAFLAKLAPDDTSKQIKVKSNIAILGVRLEAIRNNIQAVRTESEGKGCAQCPGGIPPAT